METIDKLEAVENAKSFATAEAQVTGAVNLIDWGELFPVESLSGTSLEVVKR
jgi:hypothetical protein